MDLVRVAEPCTVQSWAKAMSAETSDSDHHRAINALVLLLGDMVSSIDTARSITKAYEGSRKEDQRPRNASSSDKVHVFWALWLSDAIRRFGGATDALASLLADMSRQPNDIITRGLSKEHPHRAWTWRDLPGWSFQFAEHGLRKSNVQDDSFTAQPFDSILQGTTILRIATTLTSTSLKLRSF